LPPVQLGDLRVRGDFFGDETGGDSEGNGEIWFPLCSDAAQGWHVEMVVVVVALEDEIDFGKLVEGNAGSAMTFWSRPREGAGAIRPDGIAENVDGVHLNHDGRVADEGGANGSVGDAVGRDGAWGCVDPFAPGAGLAIQEPAKCGAAAGRGLVAGIMEMFAVEMIGWWAGVGFHC